MELVLFDLDNTLLAGDSDFDPAAETIPAVADLPESVRSAFFGGMDYAIFGRKL